MYFDFQDPFLGIPESAISRYQTAIVSKERIIVETKFINAISQFVLLRDFGFLERTYHWKQKFMNKSKGRMG